jgi:hypothetical protein
MLDNMIEEMRRLLDENVAMQNENMLLHQLCEHNEKHIKEMQSVMDLQSKIIKTKDKLIAIESKPVIKGLSWKY